MNPAEAPPLPRLGALMKIFYVAAFIFSVIVYVAIYKYLWRFVSYPIELEWREGSLWLHALAQSHGINIFANAKIAYANANHGIFDHIIKAAFARAFPFLEPQYILRVFVLLFPAISFLSIFVHSRRNLPANTALLSALCLSCAMVITVHDIGHWLTCIGRSDATAFTLLALAYLCYSTDVSTRRARLLRHGSYLAIALVLSTNWKTYPLALMLPIIMEQYHDALRIRELIRIYLLILGYTAATCALFIMLWFHGDAAMYYRFFFGFFGAQSPLPPISASFQTMIHYARTPAVAVLLLLSVLPTLLEAWRHLKHSGNWPRTWAAIATFMCFLVVVLAFKMNFSGGGFWYLSPQAIVLVVYYNTRYKIGPALAAVVLVLTLGVLSWSGNLPLMRWYYTNLGESLPAARKYTEELILLDHAFGVYSEEAFLFKRSRPLPPIDMGDVVEMFANANYYGPRFTAVYLAQESKVTAHEPVLVFVGPCASSAVKQLAENEEYCLWLKSPTLAIGGNVYVRKDHIEDMQRFLLSHATNSK